MTPRTFTLVQDSFKAVVVNEAAAEMFYTELLAIDPSIRMKFNGDMLKLRKHLLSELAVIIRLLHLRDQVAPATPTTRIVEHDVTIGHDISFGVALLRTLRRAMGDAFTREVHDAWIEAFRIVVSDAESRGCGL